MQIATGIGCVIIGAIFLTLIIVGVAGIVSLFNLISKKINRRIKNVLSTSTFVIASTIFIVALIMVLYELGFSIISMF